MIKNRWLKFFIIIILSLFLIINVFLALQAYSLTHFVEKQTSGSNLKLDFKTLIKGIDIPKPSSDILPEKSYEVKKIKLGKDKFLEAWLLSPEKKSKGIILLFHGFRAEKSTMLDRAYVYEDLGYSVLLVDFNGAGNSSGNQCTIGYKEAENVRQAYEYARNDLNEENIFLAGFSMGAAAIIKAQHDYHLNVKGIILEAPYGKMIDAVKVRMKIPYVGKTLSYLVTFWGGVVNGFNAFEMNPDEYAKKIEIPVLFLYGGRDPRIPVNESERIYTNFKSKDKTSMLFPLSYHQSYLNKYPEKWKKVNKQFLNSKN
ncbi:S9 family peptidase [Apibacter sp. HY039]|uniref:alpha/beta hydrolase family protein n=1 Tax=Apibacter sp. HY039 TaxID=2501476 RepID=UPI000FEB9983|nr:alpha/beta fold hydrolase [Apibacter sp. HY039]